MAWHEYPTNFSNGSVVNGPGSFFFKYPASIINQFGSGIIILVWLMIFGISSYLGTRKAILIASFITFILSIPLAVQSLINPTIPIILILLTIIGLISVKGDSSNY